MPNATFKTFGWPETRIAEFEHWGVMLRPAQPTLGALVVVCKEPVTAYSDVSPEGFAELKQVIAGVEAMLTATTGYEKINYLMLMMVDPDVHFHAVPRYAGDKVFEGVAFSDHGWPGPPALGKTVDLDADQRDALTALYRQHWQHSG